MSKSMVPMATTIFICMAAARRGGVVAQLWRQGSGVVSALRLDPCVDRWLDTRAMIGVRNRSEQRSLLHYRATVRGE